MYALQLEFFKTEEQCEIEALARLIAEVKNSSDKVRRGTYASINEVKRECCDLKNRLEIMERFICKGMTA